MFQESALKEPAAFDEFLALLEDQALDPMARLTLLEDMQTTLGVRESEPGLGKGRIVLSFPCLDCSRTLDNPSFEKNLLETWMPNWLGMNSGMRKRSVAEEFSYGTRKSASRAIE